ncbi:MAG: hypothetical protein LBE91_08130 [Tannerella sp.]|jgi:hypothetical protein|nr:hypothetical protein [Tannerella sp.]
MKQKKYRIRNGDFPSNTTITIENDRIILRSLSLISPENYFKIGIAGKLIRRVGDSFLMEYVIPVPRDIFWDMTDFFTWKEIEANRTTFHYQYIADEIARILKIPVEELKKAGCKRECVWARIFYSVLVRKFYHKPAKFLAGELNKNHSTICYYQNIFINLINTDKEFKSLFRQIEAFIKGYLQKEF